MSEQVTPTTIGDNVPDAQQPAIDDNQGGVQANDNWYADLGMNEDNQAYVESKGYKDIDNIIKSSQNAEAMLSDSTRIPDFKNASDEVVGNFWKNAGKPDESASYDLSMPEGLSENFSYDGEFANTFKGMAHEANLTQSQADKVHSGYVKAANDMQMAHAEAAQQQFDADVVNSNKVLAEAWGEVGSDAYKTGQDNAFKAINAGGDGLLAELKASGALGQNNEVLQPEIIKALAKMGKRLYTEGKSESGANTIIDNPFSTKSFNLQDQMTLYKTDRSRYDAYKASAVINKT